MTELFATNLSIIAKRWPIVAAAIKSQSIDHLDAHLVQGQNQTISVNGIQLSSRHDRIAEAQLFISTLPSNVHQVTVYGVGMGDVPSLLTDNPQYQKIEVCILNLAVFALLLCYTDQREWLSHPNVNLYEQAGKTLSFPYIAITPELNLVSNENAIIRDLIVYELNRNYANQQHLNNDKVEFRFNSNSKNIENDPSADLLIQYYKKPRCHVIASGPTLEDHYDFLLKQRQLPDNTRPLMIAADTSLKGLVNHGIYPDIVVSIDINIRLDHMPIEDTENISLVYFPTISPDIVREWKGNRYCAYSKHARYDTLSNYQPKLRLYTNGSVIHPIIDLAAYLGAYEISMFGCDFCYAKNKTHAFWPDGSLGPKINNAKHWVLNGRGDRVETDLNFRGYLRSLERYIKIKPNIKFYQSSLDGARILGAQYKDFTNE